MWSPNLEFYSGYSASEVQTVVPRVAHNLLTAPKLEFQCIQTKYKSSKFLRVAQMTELKRTELAFLAATTGEDIIIQR